MITLELDIYIKVNCKVICYIDKSGTVNYNGKIFASESKTPIPIASDAGWMPDAVFML